jgi:hypothetical protein
MEKQYSTLHILAAAVKDLPQPTAYRCTPRELILRCSYDWAMIYTHLLLLQDEELVELIQADTIQVSITQLGLDKTQGLPAKRETRKKSVG